MKIKLPVVFILLALMFAYCLPAYAGEASSGSLWEFQPYLRLWGIDMAGVYKGFTFVDGLDTRLWLSLGGGVEAVGFYRNSDGTPYTPPTSGTDPGAFSRTNVLWTLGLAQGLIYDQENQKNLVELIGYYRSSVENYTEANGVHARIFDSGLPDKDGITQNSLLAGIRYNGITVNQENQLRKGAFAETSLEFAPNSLNQIADFTRWNTTVIGFWPCVENDNYCIFAGDRLMYDRLYGNYIPINARTSFGGASVFPGIISTGLGGAMRGVNYGRFDGYDKLINNLELRATFPNLFKQDWIIPGVIVYYDLGYTDNLTNQLQMDQLYSAAGIAVYTHLKLSFIDLDAGFSNDYFLTEQRSTFNLLLYLQF
jgi:hypothetical protein